MIRPFIDIPGWCSLNGLFIFKCACSKCLYHIQMCLVLMFISMYVTILLKLTYHWDNLAMQLPFSLG